MSGFKPPPSSTPAYKDFIEALQEPDKLTTIVEHLMSMQIRDARNFIGDTTTTAFRRIHEHLSSAVDKALETLNRGMISEERLNSIALLFTRGLILINYQEARRQLSGKLAELIRAMIGQVLNSLRTKNVEGIKGTLESIRTLLDALLVLVYKYSR